MNLFKKEIIFELTNKCNLRCDMCHIWKEEPKKEFGTQFFEEILKEKYLRDATSICFTGGEPFILGSLNNYFSLTRKYLPKAHINISTNGFFTSRINNFLKNINRSNISITISYDGIRSHNKIRRHKKAKDNLFNTVMLIKKNFPDVKFSLKFTITRPNIDEIYDTAIQVRNLDVPFLIKIQEELRCHHKIKINEREGFFSQKEKRIILNQTKKVLDKKAGTNKKYINKLIKNFSRRNITCNINKKNLFITLDGLVYLCRKKENIGNLKFKRLKDILRSKDKKERIRQIKGCKEINCVSFGEE